ncbi:MAG: lipopolysaccharide biosynthesis protein [Methylomonas sp.]|jgi:O-antigen/teichoic acid export membrane protein|uniref:lipopolysaccharide biosynthesis protein n=1 Tax=Methylomonas sp. TaxID=418 RepID=UPI0025D0064F|nr:lipopolysaccharide biosynthesis protein [Methylomonas sp.]MCK9605935.1 lipopolysaccharide biosynthesis protein [Methylomonas sp.]
MLRVLKQQRLLGDAFWALAGQLVSAVALLAGTRMLTELVSPDIFGQVALLSGFVALGVAVFSYPFICAGMRMLPECRNQQQRAALHQAVFGLTARSTALAIAVLMLGGSVYCYVNDSEIGLYVLTGLLLAVTVRRELGIQLLIGERRQRGASFWQTSDSLLRPLVAIGLVYWAGPNPGAILLGYIFASVVSNTVWSIVHGADSESHSGSQPRLFARLRGNIWVYALPLIPMEFIFWVNGVGDRYVIGYFLSAAEVGLYAASYTIINEAFNRSAMVLLRTFQPAYFQAFAAGNGREAFSILKVWLTAVTGLGVIGTGLVMMCKDWVAELLLAQTYHAAVGLMPAIAMGSALHALGTALAQPLLAKKNTRAVLKGRLCGAIAAVISLPLLVAVYGLPGAAIANPVYFGIEALVLALLAKPWREPKDIHFAEIDTLSVDLNPSPVINS